MYFSIFTYIQVSSNKVNYGDKTEAQAGLGAVLGPSWAVLGFCFGSRGPMLPNSLNKKVSPKRSGKKLLPKLS